MVEELKKGYLIQGCVGSIMAHLGWYEWQTGGGCTAYGYNLPDGGPFNSPNWDGRYLLLTDLGGCEMPTRWDDKVMVGLYDSETGDPLDYVHEFESLVEFLREWA